MLTCKKLSFANEGKAFLKDISFYIGKGQTAFLIGLSGSGKSLLLDCIGGYKKYDGTVIHEDNFRYIKELPELCQSLTGNEYIEVLLALANNDLKSSVYSLIDKIGLNNDLGKNIKEISLYSKRILILLSSICLDSDTIILDDPFGNLDHESQKMMAKVILLLQEMGKTVLISSKELSYGYEIADTLLIMNNGRLKQINNVFNNVQDYERILISKMLR